MDGSKGINDQKRSNFNGEKGAKSTAQHIPHA